MAKQLRKRFISEIITKPKYMKLNLEAQALYPQIVLRCDNDGITEIVPINASFLYLKGEKFVKQLEKAYQELEKGNYITLIDFDTDNPLVYVNEWLEVNDSLDTRFLSPSEYRQRLFEVVPSVIKWYDIKARKLLNDILKLQSEGKEIPGTKEKQLRFFSQCTQHDLEWIPHENHTGNTCESHENHTGIPRCEHVEKKIKEKKIKEIKQKETKEDSQPITPTEIERKIFTWRFSYNKDLTGEEEQEIKEIAGEYPLTASRAFAQVFEAYPTLEKPIAYFRACCKKINPEEPARNTMPF